MIKRYYATKDNTISNAFDESLNTRATGSNMGQSDILEVFSIYAQANESSSELSRVLIEFDTTDIAADRTSGLIPGSGSVNFVLKLCNAEHQGTLPRDFHLAVQAISGAWEEGVGLDMENYSDLTYDITGSNWINRNNTFVSASATLTALSKTAGEANTRVLTVADSSGNSVNFQIDNSLSVSTATKIAFQNANSNANQFATNIATAINAANTAETLNVKATAADATVTLTQTALGSAGNSAADVVGTAITDSVITVVSQFQAGLGSGQWATAGGDFYDEPTKSNFSQRFEDGTENLEVDVTTLVEQWLNSAGNVLGSKENHGFVIKLSGSFETAQRSYFTKKFYGRGSEFFFERPRLEARWDSSRLDDRGQFYLSSSLASGADNLNTIFFYNYVRGKLADIPSIGEQLPFIHVTLFSGSSDNSTVGTEKLQLVADGTNVVAANRYVVTGGIVSTGIYSASFAYTGSSTIENIYDVWFSGSDSGPTDASSVSLANQFGTGSIEIKRFDINQHTETDKYIFSVKDRNNLYYCGQTHRIRLYAREKNWSPNIFTVATSVPRSLTFESASYQIYRVVDDKVVIPYGTGSTQHTRLSYDVSGNYFDLDTSMLEPNYTYGLNISIYDSDTQSYEQQPFLYKFRVEKNEY